MKLLPVALAIAAPMLLLPGVVTPEHPVPQTFVPSGINFAYAPDELPVPTYIVPPTPAPIATPTKPAQQAKPKAPKTYTLRPTVALYSQATLDECKLVLWSVQPYVVAGHNHCGWNWLDDISMGSLVKIEGTHDDATYKVVGHAEQKGLIAPAWFKNYDLVLQTCTTTGLGFSLAVRWSE